MAKILTVEEALKEIAQKGKSPNRFNKKNFNLLATAIANDTNFKVSVGKKVGEDYQLEDIMVTEDFRKWCKKLVENAGLDKAESEKVLSSEFKIDDVDAVLNFMTAAIYEYMAAGNRFDFPERADFKGGIYLKDVEETTVTKDRKNPKDGSFLGRYEINKKKHKILAAKSKCHAYLCSERRLDK
jgi:hypothetical protein